jgi:hypothetical protein
VNPKHVEVEAVRLPFRSGGQGEVCRIACEDIEHGLNLVLAEFADEKPLGLELISDGWLHPLTCGLHDVRDASAC